MTRYSRNEPEAEEVEGTQQADAVWFLIILGIIAYTSQPYRRLWPKSRHLSLHARLHALVLVPFIRLIGDGAKMTGYPVGLWLRGQHRFASPLFNTRSSTNRLLDT